MKKKKWIVLLITAVMSISSLTACRKKVEEASSGEAAPVEEATEEKTDAQIPESEGGLELGIPEGEEQPDYDEDDTVIIDNGGGELEVIVPEDQDFGGE